MQPEIFGFLIASSVFDFWQYGNFTFIALLAAFALVIQSFLYTNYIWLSFLLFELISISSVFFVYRFKQERLLPATKVLFIYIIAGSCFLVSIIKIPFTATFSNLSLSTFSQIFLSAAICIKSGLFPFLWPQIASVADISVSAFMHSATAIQVGVYLLNKIQITPIISTVIYYTSYSHFIFTLPIILVEQNPKKLLVHSTQISVACTLLQICLSNNADIFKLIFYQAVLKSVMFFSIPNLLKNTPTWADLFLFTTASVFYLAFSPLKFVLPYLALIKGIQLYIFCKILLKFLFKLNIFESLLAMFAAFLEVGSINNLISFDFPFFFIVSWIFGWSTSSWISATLLRMVSVYKINFNLDLLTFYFGISLFLIEKILFWLKRIIAPFFINDNCFSKKEGFIDLKKEFLFIAQKLEIIVILFIFFFFLGSRKLFGLERFIGLKNEGVKLLSQPISWISLLKKIPFKDISFLSFLLLSFNGILRTKSKLNFIFYLNSVSLIVVMLFWDYGAHEIAITQLLSDLLFTLILLKTDFKLSAISTTFLNFLIATAAFGGIILYHPGLSPSLEFPINTIQKIILDYRLIDTLFEVLIFYLIGVFLYSSNKNSTKKANEIQDSKKISS